MVIIETKTFTRLIKSMMSDDEYSRFQEVLVSRPDAGSLIKHSGGLRKIRWSHAEKGKRGGARFIYYWIAQDDQIYMLYTYAKSEQQDLTPSQLKCLRELVET